MLGAGGEEEHARFRLRRCLPVRLKAPRLDARDGVVAVEELQLACESLALERPGGVAPDPPKLRKAELRALDAETPARLAVEPWFDAGADEDVRRLTARIAYFATAGERREAAARPPVRLALRGAVS